MRCSIPSQDETARWNRAVDDAKQKQAQNETWWFCRWPHMSLKELRFSERHRWYWFLRVGIINAIRVVRSKKRQRGNL